MTPRQLPQTNRLSGTQRPKGSPRNAFVALRQALAEGGTVAAMRIARQGLPVQLLQGLADHYQLSLTRVYSLAGLTAATAQRLRRNNHPLSPATTERLTRIALIEADAIDALGSQARAQQWLLTPSVLLSGETPLAMTDTGFGTDEVRRILIALQCGSVA